MLSEAKHLVLDAIFFAWSTQRPVVAVVFSSPIHNGKPSGRRQLQRFLCGGKNLPAGGKANTG